jgi:hypothetical protein
LAREAGAVVGLGCDVVDGVGGCLGGVEDDVVHECAIEEGFDGKIFVRHWHRMNFAALAGIEAREQDR